MARVLVTGSSEGLGLLAGQIIQDEGHAVTLHARNPARAADARAGLPGCEAVVVGDVSSLDGMRAVAEQANALGTFDAVIHNVAIGYQERRRNQTGDGVEQVFAVNVLAPYLLTALIHRPRRLIYLSSGMHRGGTPSLDDPQWTQRR
jgi:NAD(P)-dependent dehydrogenase (short-subunit alcohol dehydrogenase family)